MEVSHRFKNHCLEKEYSKVTIDHYVPSLLDSWIIWIPKGSAIAEKEINLPLINEYISKRWQAYTYKTVEQKYLFPARPFSSFLGERRSSRWIFPARPPMVPGKEQNRIPSVWTKDELKKPDRCHWQGSPKGQRDMPSSFWPLPWGYAAPILKIETRSLSLGREKLVFTPIQTQGCIPSLDREVGWAIIDTWNMDGHKRPTLSVCQAYRPVGPFPKLTMGTTNWSKGIWNWPIYHFKKKRRDASLRHTWPV